MIVGDRSIKADSSETSSHACKKDKAARERNVNYLKIVEFLKENRGVRHFLFHMFEKEVKEGIRKGSYEYVTGSEMYNSETSEEHIIPKVIEKTGSDATENSINKLKEIKPENISNQKYVNLVWRLGNLVALWNTTNKSLSDKSPKEKMSAYKNAEEYTAQLIYNNGVTGDGDKQDGESARKFLKSIFKIIIQRCIRFV